MEKKVFIILFAQFLWFSVYCQSQTTEKLKIFIEGNTFDFNYIRNNTSFVDFVNDPKVSDVHIISTKQPTGGGGQQFTLNYNSAAFENIPNFKLTCIATSFDTDELIRQRLVKSLQSGLLPYINEKNGLQAIQISNANSTKTSEQKGTSEINDPWRQWVFIFDADAGLNGEEQKQNLNYSFSGRAVKVTDAWKINNEYDYERKEGTIKKDNGEIINTLKAANTE